MKNTWAIVQKELQQYFVSPIAYVVMMIFLTISGYFFYTSLIRFQQDIERSKMMMQMYRNPEILDQINLNQMVILPSISPLFMVLLFLLPLIMMRSFAEEKRQKTDELLMTSPLTANEILAGKFLGSLIFLVITILPTSLYHVFLFQYSSPELGPLLCSYLALFLFIVMGVSIGLFASSLTENQIIAAIICFAILFFLFLVRFLGVNEGNILSSIARYLAMFTHMEKLLNGLVDTRDLIYFLSISALFLFLTKRSLESGSWR